MKYTTAKEKVSEIRQKLSDVKAQLSELEDSKEQLMQDFENSYQSLVDAKAQLIVGEGSQKDVEQSEKLNKKLKSELDQLKSDIDVSNRSIEILSDKLNDADAEFRQVAKEHHKEQISPVINRIAEAMQSIEKELETLSEYRQVLQKDGLNTGSFMAGITRDSQVLINTKTLSGMDIRNFLTSNKISQ